MSTTPTKTPSSPSIMGTPSIGKPLPIPGPSSPLPIPNILEDPLDSENASSKNTPVVEIAKFSVGDEQHPLVRHLVANIHLYAHIIQLLQMQKVPLTLE